ncbi:CarboxypepD_reg-like domain-containing protein [Chishuiella changwenlii]|uniref:CarboxypepD_reg-like domain-containing protein n=1 Tax=Chishuiella changwenlii TaxID=1434701 RepID=A0A1M6T213_9FLAO|nr:DUF5686 family protein [Chishuiella changwenlii]GGE94568.1 membrane protein [Chishuiella changwenlii]SHK50838.1 CarboxypepD_reg-like domain-containing protein [Chishuiella changwenlii]
MKSYIAALFFTLCAIINAQVKIQGRVIDSETLKPIPYADIKLPELKISATSNSDGTFYIESSQNSTQLVVSKSGYEIANFVLEKKIDYNFTAQLFIDNNDDDIEEGNVVDLKTAVVSSAKKKRLKKKENPAYAILREVWKHKKKNGVKLTSNYQYDEYEKLQFDISNIDSTFMKKKIFRGMEFVFEKVDTSSINGKTFLPAFLNEAIYKVSGTNDPITKERRELVANKTSGFEKNEMVASMVKNLFKDVDIYDNRVNILNIKFVSPIASDGFAVYDYELKDTIDVDGVEVYRIKYYPRRAGELTFKGELFIAKDNYAVKEVVMETTKDINVNFVRNVFMNLQFDIPNDSIFYPKKEYAMLDMTILSKKEDGKGIFAHKTVNYYNYDFETKHPEKYYTERLDPTNFSLNEKSDEFWKENRPEALTKNQEGIYETLEQLNKVPKFNNIVKVVEILGSGYYNVGVIDIGNLYPSFGYNQIEGVRLRAGARTYFSQNDMWRAQGFVAYGFKDDKFKYGADFRYMFNQVNRFQVGIGTKRDVEQLAATLTSSDGIMTRSFASSSIINQGDNKLLSNNNLTNVYTSIDPWKNVTFRLDGNYQFIQPADSQYFSIAYEKDGRIKETLTNSSLSASIIARPGAKFSQHGIDRREMGNLAPTIMLRYTKGLKGVINSDFEYDKLQFLYSQPILVGSFGRSLVTVEAGKTFQGVPLSLMSAIPGNESYGQVYGTFSQLGYYDFVTDEYVTLNWEHHFRGWFFNKIPFIKKLKLREVTFLRGAYGNISEKSKAINRSTVEYFAPNQQIYYEYGFGVENIGFGNIRPIRIDFNWRGNYNYLPNVRKFGVTIGLGWNL